MNVATKIVRIFLIVVVSIIALNVLLYLVFSIPAVQKRAAEMALNRLQPKLQAEMGLESIRIRLFNRVELSGLYLSDRQNDTLLYVHRLTTQFSARDLFRNNISVHRLQMDDFSINVSRETPNDSLNFQFVIDAFARPPDTTVVQQRAAWHITVNDLILQNGTLRFNVHSEPETPDIFNTNHLEIRGFNFRSRVDFRNAQDMRVDILSLGLRETNSGIALNNFNGSVLAMGNLLWSNAIEINVNNSYFSLSNVRYNTVTQEFAVLMESETDLQDLQRFVPLFDHLEHSVSLSLDAEGRLPQVSLNHFHLAYDSTTVDLSASLADIRDPKHSDMMLNIGNLIVSQDNLQAFIRIGNPEFESPEQLRVLGDVHVNLQAHGTMNRFHYEGDIQIEQGDLHIAGIGRFHDNFDLISFEGPVTANHIHVAGVIGDASGIDFATLFTNAKVIIPSGNNEPVTIVADGHLASVYYNQFRYEDLFFTGEVVAEGQGGETTISAHVHTESELNQFDLNANLAFGNEMQFVVNGAIDRLDLRPFLMRPGWQTPSIATQIDIDMRGETMDSMVGIVLLLNTSLSDHHFIYNPGPIMLQAADISDGRQRMELRTMFLEASLEGNYYFSTIGSELMHALRPHLPSVITAEQAQLHADPQNNFSFNIALRNTEDLAHALSLPFYNVELANLSGTINFADTDPFAIDAHLPRIMVSGNDIRETKLSFLSSSTDGISLDLNTYLSQRRGFSHIQLNTTTSNDSIDNRIAFTINSPTTTSNGELLVTMGFLRTLQNELITTTHIHPATISFNDTGIDVNEAFVVQSPQRVEVSNFGLHENEMLLFGLAGVASTSAEDTLHLFFQNTELFNVLSAFNIRTISGAINGGVHINQALHHPMIRTQDLRIDNIAMHNDTIGTLIVNGNWNSENIGLDLDAYLIEEGNRNLTIRGFIPTASTSPYRMGVFAHIEQFDLSTVLPFAEGIFSELSGTLSSNVNITGTFAEPIIQGWIGIDEGVIRIAYTGVTYYISDIIAIRRDNIGFDNLVIRDQNGNTATLNVMLTHANFGRMMYSANIVLDDFLLLNNERRTDLLAHGNLSLSGNLNITGSSAGIFGEGVLQPSSRSNVNITIPTFATADQFSNVVFVNQQPPEMPEFLWRDGYDQLDTRAIAVPIVMQVQLLLNPLLEAGVILDPVSGNALHNIRGNGVLDFRYDSRANVPVNIFGDYVIQEGFFHFSLRNLRNINFDIREGSSLTMVGNPLNTRFNITAYHQTRADLNTLHSTVFRDMPSTRVRANALLEITGDVQNMELNPSIELPDASNEIQQRVNSLLDSDEIKLQQFVYLAAFGSFIPVEGLLNLTGANVFTQVGVTMLSQTLDGIFSDALGTNWRIGTSLQTEPGTIDNVRVGVDLSGRLFNDRLHITTNLSYGEESIHETHQAFIGEFEMEYEINSWLRLRVYNRANDRIHRRSPVTQGAGVVVTRQARTFENLFRFRRRVEE